MATAELPKPASISWEGDSWKVLKSWPKTIQWDFGNSLREMQFGRPARLNVRPMQSIDQGVFELKDSDEKTWYRMVYLARIHNTIYILDCFEKDTAKTERKDLNTARTRLSVVRQRLQEQRRHEKLSSK
ncbi:type II toxin-antitoxin system RelE/ParE family toxin [Granulicella paludicola]|uniref:type II toxin-antitoxin system RelE/ParE family toxin n=1 Tax=Granulicella paludicola TaxID=474951 RepID=UPI0021E0D0C6|nr:type II toxin-antitoxin system RelE/ParE family toxin [Granulicella paludicola]